MLIVLIFVQVLVFLGIFIIIYLNMTEKVLHMYDIEFLNFVIDRFYFPNPPKPKSSKYLFTMNPRKMSGVTDP